jgi:hypothetical protein
MNGSLTCEKKRVKVKIYQRKESKKTTITFNQIVWTQTECTHTHTQILNSNPDPNTPNSWFFTVGYANELYILISGKRQTHPVSLTGIATLLFCSTVCSRLAMHKIQHHLKYCMCTQFLQLFAATPLF